MEHFCDNPRCDLYKVEYSGSDYYFRADGMDDKRHVRKKYFVFGRLANQSLHFCDTCMGVSEIIEETIDIANGRAEDLQ